MVKMKNLLSTPTLDAIFDNLREEFIEHISAPEFQNLDPQFLVDGFDMHLFRFQQMFILLRDISLANHALTTHSITSALVPEGFSKGDSIPLIIQRDEYLTVSIGQPPIDMEDSSDPDVVTIATIQLPEGVAPPFSGKTAVITTPDKDTEAALTTHEKSLSITHIMWGKYIMRLTQNLRPPSSLN